ncbi:hypothetical protein BJF85_12105 [Saccharomonospora sp. CUA-673]|nr:hypothetical protein [Saccharomonospora sp. CUA-673]OLT48550.1 hypothetical protein BJF85_12105 [Saccharomonospora sp. CUA-673]
MADRDEAEESEESEDAAEQVSDADVPTGSSAEFPDVYLDVPQVKVDEISLEVENLRAKVSLQAEVLDLLKLNVGVDAELGRVALQITGVEAQAQLTVRLDNVAGILARVLATIDRNPQILEHLTQGLGRAAEEVGQGAGSAVRNIGEGTGDAVDNVGSGAGEAVREVGSGAGSAVENVGEGAGSGVEQLGSGAGNAAENIGS